MNRPMRPLAEALAAYGRELTALPEEILPLHACLHRVLREPLLARTDLPRHSQSALDGYVLRDEDAQAAPITLRISDAIAAGDTRDLRPLERGEAQRILTGARVPPGAVAVVAQERTEVRGSEVFIHRPLEAGANVRWQGEEKKAGAELATAGLRLNAGHLAAAAIAGYGALRVTRAPRIAVLVTGDELREPGSHLADGQIWDSNGPLVRAWLAQSGYAAETLRVPDDEAQVRVALEDAMRNHDLVLSTGGVSVGDRDYVLPVAEKLGVRRVFWEVAQKPGKPLYFGLFNSPSPPAQRGERAGVRGVLDAALTPSGSANGEAPLTLPSPLTSEGRGKNSSCALLGMPGNPAAVLVCLALHVRSLLNALEGAASPGPDWQSGRLEEKVKSDAQRDRLVRMHRATDASGQVLLKALPNQDSHMLSNLITANALAHLPARATAYEAGECVHWIALP